MELAKKLDALEGLRAESRKPYAERKLEEYHDILDVSAPERAEAAEGERDDWMERWREVCERS